MDFKTRNFDWKVSRSFDFSLAPIASIGIGLLLAAIVGGGTYGWVSNIVKLTGSSFDPVGGVVVVRAIGIPIVPLGIVMGYVP